MQVCLILEIETACMLKYIEIETASMLNMNIETAGMLNYENRNCKFA